MRDDWLGKFFLAQGRKELQSTVLRAETNCRNLVVLTTAFAALTLCSADT